MLWATVSEKFASEVDWKLVFQPNFFLKQNWSLPIAWTLSTISGANPGWTSISKELAFPDVCVILIPFDCCCGAKCFPFSGEQFANMQLALCTSASTEGWIEASFLGEKGETISHLQNWVALAALCYRTGKDFLGKCKLVICFMRQSNSWSYLWCSSV